MTKMNNTIRIFVLLCTQEHDENVFFHSRPPAPKKTEQSWTTRWKQFLFSETVPVLGESERVYLISIVFCKYKRKQLRKDDVEQIAKHAVQFVYRRSSYFADYSQEAAFSGVAFTENIHKGRKKSIR